MSLPLDWSSKMQRIVRDCVDNVVRSHPRSNREKNLLMGFTMEEISKQILAKGLADFSAGYSHTSAQSVHAGRSGSRGWPTSAPATRIRPAICPRTSW